MKNNYFKYEDLKYHQESGFAIGTKFALPYSNLFMAGLEKRIFQNSEFESFLWLEYLNLNEIFCIWTQGFQKLKGLFNCISSPHLTINFTMDYCATIDKLETDLYCKPNDTHQYFHVQLCHRNLNK